MTDNEIVKALECCNHDFVWQKKCFDCEYATFEGNCGKELIKDTLDLINRLQAENEKLQKKFTFANECIGDVEDALSRGSDNDWANKAIDEYNECLKNCI